MRLLLVEDDPGLSRSLKLELENAGFAVDCATDGEAAEFLGSTESYDIVILDLGLPKMPGMEVLRRWRRTENQVPVIVLTARDAWHEKVDGFKAGADDYLGKPFHSEELLARVRALLKRFHGRMQPQLAACGLVLDEDTQTVSVGGRSEQLTAIEFRLLRYFMLHPGKVFTRTHLLEHIYQYDSDPASNVIEVYVNRLRRKLGNGLIATRRGQGYVFGEKA
ncbi:response regulator transcription factor [Methylomonas koyamae]|uniref:response regulator transcription factor n=1 Tax=Methylomonas koyamae TaxID=702114 RepID=UPI001C3398A8|nr:response regulator transcription factor [Methylomonas koyamae]BBL58790.1 DNA-binding response regulator [Methylomonas koyamae]